jgi:hypothetical protein
VSSRVEIPSTYPNLLHNAGLTPSGEAEGALAAWRSLFDLIAPDAVIFDHAPIALLASSNYQFRRILIGTGFTCPPPVERFPDWRAGDRPEPDPTVHQSEASVLEVINQYRARVNAPPLARLSHLFAEADLTLLTTVRELDHFPDRTTGQYLGNWVPGNEGLAPIWPEGSGKRLFAYLKPYRELPFLLNRLAASRRPTVVYIADCPPELRRVNCATVSVQTTPVAFDEVAQQCDACILHAGHGSTLQFLLRGKPLFLLPLLLEQRLTAVRVAKLGAGICVDPHDKGAVRERLSEFLVDHAHRAGAERFAAEYRSTTPSGQLDRTVHAIQRLFSG